MALRVVVLGLLLAAGWSAGCASRTQTVEPPRTSALTERGPGVGVETTYWVLTDPLRGDPLPGPGLPIREAVRPFLNGPAPIPAEDEATLRANGLRLVLVPIEALSALRSRLRIVGPIQQEWLGEAPRWTALSKGPAWNGAQSLQFDNGVVTFEPGSLRMIVRTWLAPGEDKGGAFYAATLQFECAPQFVPAHSQRTLEEALLRPRVSASAEDVGQVLSRLRARLTLDGSSALLIIPERPETPWPRAAGDRTPASGETTAHTPVAAESAAAAEPVGPELPRFATVGEAMLTDALASGGGTMRVVIVVVPSVPPRFTLSGP